MPLFQAKRKNPANGAEESAYIEAADRQHAIAALRRKGWASAEWLDIIPRGFDLPDGAEITHAAAVLRSRPRRLVKLSESGLVQRPILTIALGVGCGIVIGVVALTILNAVLAVLGLSAAKLFG
ncbi:MAG: hypothetical protein AAFS11_08085 [Planctomycetota bacterium]